MSERSCLRITPLPEDLSASRIRTAFLARFHDPHPSMPSTDERPATGTRPCRVLDLEQQLLLLLLGTFLGSLLVVLLRNPDTTLETARPDQLLDPVEGRCELLPESPRPTVVLPDSIREELRRGPSTMTTALPARERNLLGGTPFRDVIPRLSRTLHLKCPLLDTIQPLAPKGVHPARRKALHQRNGLILIRCPHQDHLMEMRVPARRPVGHFCSRDATDDPLPRRAIGQLLMGNLLVVTPLAMGCLGLLQRIDLRLERVRDRMASRQRNHHRDHPPTIAVCRLRTPPRQQGVHLLHPNPRDPVCADRADPEQTTGLQAGEARLAPRTAPELNRCVLALHTPPASGYAPVWQDLRSAALKGIPFPPEPVCGLGAANAFSKTTKTRLRSLLRPALRFRLIVSAVWQHEPPAHTCSGGRNVDIG